MLEIISLFTCFRPLLSATTSAQFARVGCALIAMTSRVTMLGISRWAGKGGSYRTIQRFFNTVIPWGRVCWLFFKTHLLDRDGEYLIAADQTTVSKSEKQTPVHNAANLLMFMVNLSAKRCAPFRVQHGEFSVLDLKAHYRGLKYLHEILK